MAKVDMLGARGHLLQRKKRKLVKLHDDGSFLPPNLSDISRHTLKQPHNQSLNCNAFLFERGGLFGLPRKQKIGVKMFGFKKVKLERNADNSGVEFWA